jgi:DNA helicase-2/ATP-dependent DNA helicase PcrA
VLGCIGVATLTESRRDVWPNGRGHASDLDRIVAPARGKVAGMAYSFTLEQQRAINHVDGNLQLIACAGSGKTEVLANRVARLLDPGASPANLPRHIAAFTFTEKAAGELKERIGRRVEQHWGPLVGMAELYVGTIHGFCLDLLQTEVPELLKFGVLNEVQQTLLIDRNSRSSGLTQTTTLDGTKLKRYVDTSRYLQCLSILREAEVDAAALDGTSMAAGLDAYRALLNDKRYFDYTAILEQAVLRLEQDAAVRERIGGRLRHVIVDEYQDVNPIQERLVRALHELGARICVVGDDDQTIYQWRGSDVHQIVSFADRYPKVERVTLAENFRSSEAIVSVAREFIGKNQVRLQKAMESTGAQPFESSDVCALPFDDDEEEAAWLVKTIAELRGLAFCDADGSSRGLAYSDMAILLRSVKNNGPTITDALRAADIPFVISGMNKLFESPEAEAARQLFYFIADYEQGYDAATLSEHWLRAELGVDASKLELAIAEVKAVRDLFIQHPDQQRWSDYNIQRTFMRFLELIELREETVPRGRDGSERGEVVLYNLGRFSQLISDFETIHFHSEPAKKYETFSKFLEHQVEDAYPEGGQDVAFANPDAVRIMTIHQAKGMQWPVVFLPALLKNRFPQPRMGGRQPHHIIPAGAVSSYERYRGDIEDERRLFYVALTRAQKFLFLTWGPIAGKNNRYQKPSEFWEDVLASKYIKRRRPSFTERPRLPAQPKTSVANVTLSFSDLKYFLLCPYQFKLRMLYGFNPPLDEALGYGKSLHDALAEVHARAVAGDVAKPSEAPRLVDTHLHVPFAYPALRDELREAAVKTVADYLEANALNDVEFSEKAIEIDLGNGVRVNGRIDLVRRIATGDTTIVDLKSTRRAQAEELTEAQLHIYALGYRELTGRDADFVEIYNLDEGKRVPRSVDEELIEDVRGDVQRAAKSLRVNSFDPQPERAKCSKCDYLAFCSKGQAKLGRNGTKEP